MSVFPSATAPRAASSRVAAALRFVQWSEQRLPTVARFLTAPTVAGVVTEKSELGTVYLPLSAEPHCLIVYFTEFPPSARWLAGSLSVRLNARVLVPAVLPSHDPDAAALVARAITGLAPTVDRDQTTVVGEENGARSAIAAAVGNGQSSRTPVSRLALLYPPEVPETLPGTLPTTMLQVAHGAANRPQLVQFDRALRHSGVAVRETDYRTVGDQWARYPKRVTGSKRALDDLVGFLDRGVGTPSTFEIIPGWDLH